jgi:hypothetical protein
MAGEMPAYLIVGFVSHIAFFEKSFSSQHTNSFAAFAYHATGDAGVLSSVISQDVCSQGRETLEFCGSDSARTI